LGFLLKRLSKSSNKQKGGIFDPYQKQLEIFQIQPQPQERRPITKPISAKQIENETNEVLKAFQTYVKEVKETSLKLNELKKMLKSGEIPESAYNIILKELGTQLSISIKEIYRLRETLELAKAKAKLEWAKEKIGIREFEESESYRGLEEDIDLKRRLYAPLHEWKELIARIDSALSSLTVDEEISIIEQYLYLIKEGASIIGGSEEIERAKSICQKRLDSISKRWTTVRSQKMEEVMDLELKASRIKNEIKEVEVRFAVGELEQSEYDYRISTLRGALNSVEKEMSEIRNYIEDIDTRIFRCLELIRESA